MDVQAMQNLLADLSREVGVVERPRKPHGFWTPYAWAVRALVTMNGMSVSDAAKVVIRNAGLQVTAPDIACVRVVYYKIRDTAWPEGMYDALMGRLKEMGGVSVVPAQVLPDPVLPYPDEDVPEEESPTPDRDDDFLIPDDLRAELEAELQSGFIDPDADPDYQPEEFTP